jgi:sugar lactone lactonase YvrE
MVDFSDIFGNNLIEKVLTGFQFTEGPLWIPDGFLLFSDIPADTVYKYEPGSKHEIFLKPSEHTNGLTLDKQGRLVMCSHLRKVKRLEKNGSQIILAEYFKGKRLNSPNDIVVKSDESIYFTDPPFGLPNRTEGKELDYSGVYKIDTDGSLVLLDDSIMLPNGLAFSPDESILYVDDSWDGQIYAFDVTVDGLLKNKRSFARVGVGESGKGAADGLKVDVDGNVFVTGPEGISVFTSDGLKIGVLECPEIPANLAWGGNNHQILYITARTSLYRIRTKTRGSSLIPDFIPIPIF